MNQLIDPRNKLLAIMSAIALFTMTPTVTYSQDSVVLDEIIITAQKREQSLQDVGVSVTAFTGEQLKSWDIQCLKTLLHKYPVWKVLVWEAVTHLQYVALVKMTTPQTRKLLYPSMLMKPMWLQTFRAALQYSI